MTETKKYKLRVPEFSEVDRLCQNTHDAYKGDTMMTMIHIAMSFLSCFPEKPTLEQLAKIHSHVCFTVTKAMRKELEEKDVENG